MRDFCYEEHPEQRQGTRLQPDPGVELPRWSLGHDPPRPDVPEGYIAFEFAAGWPWTAWYGAYETNLLPLETRQTTLRKGYAIIAPPPGKPGGRSRSN